MSARVLASKIGIAFNEPNLNLNFQPNRTTFSMDTLLVWNDPDELGGCRGGCGELLTSRT